jgi:hypothetical protein
MTWESVQAKIRFWTLGAWSETGWTGPLSADDGFKTTIIAILQQLYQESPTAARYLDNLTSGNRTLKIAPLAAGNAENSPAVASAAGQPNEGLQINLAKAASDLYWFNENGKLVLADIRLTIAHELSHLVDNTVYANGIGASDPTVNNEFNPTDEVQNLANFDFDGRAVRDQNRIAREMGLSDQLRASYQGTDYIRFFPGHVPLHDYTNGEKIDDVRYGAAQVGAPTPGNFDNIDHSARTDNSRDLIFAFTGNDRIFAGGGRDYIYGGAGSDLIHGGYRNGTDAQYATDGIDTAGYSDVPATGSGIKIYIGSKEAPNTLYAEEVDISRATFVTDLGNPSDVDTLISIERINGTVHDDVLKIDSFDPKRFADRRTGQGGVDLILLGSQDTTGAFHGDKLDLSGLDQAVRAIIGRDSSGTPDSNSNVGLSLRSTPAFEIAIGGAEWIVGTDYNDRIELYANGLTIETGIGNDTVIVDGDGNFLFTGDGRDTVTISRNDNTFFDDSGVTILSVTGYQNILSTGNKADIITIDGHYNRLTAGGGKDEITVSGSYNTIDAGDGNDTITITEPSGTVWLDFNYVSGGIGVDTFIIKADACRAQLYGGAGNDIFDGLAHARTGNVLSAIVINYARGDGSDTIKASFDFDISTLNFSNKDTLLGGGIYDSTGIHSIVLTDIYRSQVKLVWTPVLLDSEGGNGEGHYLYHGMLKLVDAADGGVIFDFGDTIGETFGVDAFSDPSQYQFDSLPYVQFADGSSLNSGDGMVPIIA